eukprot:1168215-Amphidinium_carterae.1
MCAYGLWQPSSPAKQTPDLKAGTSTQSARQQLVSHLINCHGSLEKGLAVYDLDADRSLTAEELARAAAQAGLQPRQVDEVTAFVFKVRWLAQPLATVAERLTGLGLGSIKQQGDSPLTNIKQVVHAVVKAKSAFNTAM